MKFINSMSSRKFLVFVIGSVFFSVGLLNQSGWLIVASVYVGVNVLNKLVDNNKIGINITGGKKK